MLQLPVGCKVWTHTGSLLDAGGTFIEESGYLEGGFDFGRILFKAYSAPKLSNVSMGQATRNVM